MLCDLNNNLCIVAILYLQASLCSRGNENLAVIYLWQGVFENETRFFHSMFWDSVENGQIDMMQYLSEKPPHINKFDQLEWTYAHTIAYCVHPKLRNDTPVTQNQLAVLKQLFMKHYNDLTKFSHGGNLPIHLACQMNNLAILEIIIEVANEKFPQEQFEDMLNTAKQDKYWQYTPLMIAIKHNSVDCVKILCQEDCVVDGILNATSRYPTYNSLEFACYYNNIDILEILCNLCDLEQLNSNLIAVAKYGSFKRCLRSNCYEFLNDLFNNNSKNDSNNTLGSKPSKSLSIDVPSYFDNDKDKNKLKLMCCHKHLLSWPGTNTQTCDVCKEKNTGCRSCSRCTNKEDCKLFPATICETCVIATSVWSSIVYATENFSINPDLSKIISELINPDIANRVKFTVHIYDQNILVLLLRICKMSYLYILTDSRIGTTI